MVFPRCHGSVNATRSCTLQIQLDDLENNQLSAVNASLAGNTKSDEEFVRDLTRSSFECEQKLEAVAEGIKGTEDEIDKLEDIIKALLRLLRRLARAGGPL